MKNKNNNNNVTFAGHTFNGVHNTDDLCYNMLMLETKDAVSYHNQYMATIAQMAENIRFYINADESVVPDIESDLLDVMDSGSETAIETMIQSWMQNKNG